MGLALAFVFALGMAVVAVHSVPVGEWAVAVALEEPVDSWRWVLKIYDLRVTSLVAHNFENHCERNQHYRCRSSLERSCVKKDTTAHGREK